MQKWRRKDGVPRGRARCYRCRHDAGTEFHAGDDCLCGGSYIELQDLAVLERLLEDTALELYAPGRAAQARPTAYQLLVEALQDWCKGFRRTSEWPERLEKYLQDHGHNITEPAGPAPGPAADAAEGDRDNGTQEPGPAQFMGMLRNMETKELNLGCGLAVDSQHQGPGPVKSVYWLDPESDLDVRLQLARDMTAGGLAGLDEAAAEFHLKPPTAAEAATLARATDSSKAADPQPHATNGEACPTGRGQAEPVAAGPLHKDMLELERQVEADNATLPDLVLYAHGPHAKPAGLYLSMAEVGHLVRTLQVSQGHLEGLAGPRQLALADQLGAAVDRLRTAGGGHV